MSPTIREEVGLSFDDVLLVPKKGIVKSRDNVNVGTRLAGNWFLSNPLCSSPMSSVTDWRLARRISELGGMGFIHRFMPIKDQVEQYKKATERRAANDLVPIADTHWAGCAVGISDGHKRMEALFRAGCRLFLIDTAHGHSEQTGDFLDRIPTNTRFASTVIAGNVCEAEGAAFLAEAGGDGIRVGIGNGSACSTRSATGSGVPQLTALLECVDAVKDMKDQNHQPITIISCGGIRNGSDVSKAIAAGSAAVIIGGLFANAKESPVPGMYYGEASGYRTSRYIEGSSTTTADNASTTRSVPLETISETLLDGLRSAISYSGAQNIKDFQEKAEFIKVAPGVKEESRVRI